MNSEKIGKIIKEKRKEKNLTQEELANILYVTNKTISKWENGRGTPSIELLIPLCEALDIELKDLLQGKENKTYEELLIDELKNKKRRNIIELISGIVICLFLCFLEVILYVAHVSDKIGTIIFISFIVILLIIDVCNYFCYKK